MQIIIVKIDVVTQEIAAIKKAGAALFPFCLYSTNSTTRREANNKEITDTTKTMIAKR